MKIRVVFYIFLGFFLSACEETKSVEYYQEHPEEAREISLKCRSTLTLSQNCVNAYKVGFPRDDENNSSIP